MRTRKVSLVFAAAALVAGIGIGSGVAVAATTGIKTSPAPGLTGISGALASNCTPLIASKRYASAALTDGCSITFPQSEFPHGEPVFVGNALNGNIAGINTSGSGSNWVIDVYLSTPEPLLFTISAAD